MAYIESFFYYWLFVLIGGIVIYAFLFVIGGMIRGVLHLRHSTNEKLLSFLSIKKSLKIFAPLYIFSFGFFYIDKASDYLWGDRAYKEAKAYAIAGDYLFLWKNLTFAFVYPDHPIVRPLRAVHESILQKMFQYIPETDGEREIWRYKFDLFDYARTMYAPLSDYSIHEHIKPNNPAASFRPELIPILDSIYHTMDAMNTKPIKDKEFDRYDRYFVSISVAPYFYEYMENYISVDTEKYLEPWEWKKRNPNELSTWKKWDKLYQTPELKTKFIRYLSFLDAMHKRFGEDKALSQRLEEQPHTKAAFYWATVNSSDHFQFLKTKMDDIHPCGTSDFEKFVMYYKEFTDWAYRTPGSSYAGLSQRDRGNYDFMIEQRADESYYVAKYICKIPFEYIVSSERNIPQEYREKNFAYSNELHSGVKTIRQIEQKQTQGVNNGR